MKKPIFALFICTAVLYGKMLAQHPNLPEPYATKSSMNFSKVIGWPADKTPVAPKGFTVTKYADGFTSPRWMYVTPNGDVLVAESSTEYKGVTKLAVAFSEKLKSQHEDKSANKITLLRDADKDGKPELRTVFLAELNQPLGMLVLGNFFYVANTDAVVRYPYKPGQTRIMDNGEKVIDLPAGGRHWTRSLLTDGKKIYIGVGSASNNAENGIEEEKERACIIEINPDGTGNKDL